jgi:transcriptional regulator with XRE-family HTH domain
MLRFRTATSFNRVREFRQKLSMSQAALARAAGIARPTLARLDANPTAMPSVEIAVRLSEALGIDVTELISTSRRPDKD